MSKDNKEQLLKAVESMISSLKKADPKTHLPGVMLDKNAAPAQAPAPAKPKAPALPKMNKPSAPSKPKSPEMHMSEDTAEKDLSSSQKLAGCLKKAMQVTKAEDGSEKKSWKLKKDQVITDKGFGKITIKSEKEVKKDEVVPDKGFGKIIIKKELNKAADIKVEQKEQSLSSKVKEAAPSVPVSAINEKKNLKKDK